MKNATTTQDGDTILKSKKLCTSMKPQQDVTSANNLTGFIAQDESEITTNFVCFSRLPLEIRLIIWNLAVTPRIVGLIKRDGQIVPEHFTRRYATIPLLSTCREARQELLKVYPTCFQGPTGELRGIRFNYSLDTALIETKKTYTISASDTLPQFFSDTDLNSIQNLAFHFRSVEYFFHTWEPFAEFKSLCQLILIAPPLERSRSAKCIYPLRFNDMLPDNRIGGINPWAEYYKVVTTRMRLCKRDFPDWLVPEVSVHMLSRVDKENSEA